MQITSGGLCARPTPLCCEVDVDITTLPGRPSTSAPQLLAWLTGLQTRRSPARAGALPQLSSHC